MTIETIKKGLNRPKPLFIGEDTAMKSAILIPLVLVNNEWHVLFEVRSLSMRRQPGDISFPGGRIDSADASPKDAAIRETHEELGVDASSIQIVGELSPFIPASTFVVYPFVATIDDHRACRLNKLEVEEVFTVPVDWLLNHKPYKHLIPLQPQPPTDFPYEKIANGNQYQWGLKNMEEWFYEYNGYTIWGLTARILKHFIETIKK
ncbi:CoA pyrophosphatase [Jeotgalibacillus sp. S-D1]|uniref:NUDIX hydrolase n=1 Tax=Jeotgalibacillus sp. S-D1 TaxID=2552189 RepID=UPI00105A9957|nr:CoA pyrophosphatase [Jeotgalibacillus sp. S-D1]TDL32578.1 CoA pyrophosphatase [Jeotgalibacillus sp. S-D1]